MNRVILALAVLVVLGCEGGGADVACGVGDDTNTEWTPACVAGCEECILRGGDEGDCAGLAGSCFDAAAAGGNPCEAAYQDDCESHMDYVVCALAQSSCLVTACLTGVEIPMGCLLD